MSDDTSSQSSGDISEERNDSPGHSSCHEKTLLSKDSPLEAQMEIKKELVADDSTSEADERGEPLFVLKSLNCPICKLECGGQSDWDEHIAKHGLPLRCFYCQDVFPDVMKLGEHRGKCPNGKEKLRGCSTCGKTLANLETLLTHEYLVHQPSSEQRTIPREKHAPRESRQQTMYTCSVCYEKHEGFESMQNHLSKHLESLGSSGKELECQICSVVFVSRAALSTHISSPRHREKVMRIKNLFKCSHCGTVFPSRDGYAMHMLDIAREESENDLARKTIGHSTTTNPLGPHAAVGVTGPDPVESNAKAVEKSVGVTNSDKVKVPPVVIKQEPIDPDDEPSENAESGDGGSSTQEVLGKEVKRGLNNNMLQNLMNDGYKCGLCGKRLEDQDSFAMHMMYHARTMEEQSQKQRIMSGKVPSLRQVKLEPGEGSEPGEDESYAQAVGIVCPHCMVTFVTRDALAMHTMEEHADKAYSQKSSLNRLLRVGLHGSSLNVPQTSISYPCQVCGRSFKDQDTLAMHMLMHSQSELLLLAHKPSSTINLSELSRSPKSTHSGTSQSDDWQKSILNALYKDLPGIQSGRSKTSQLEVDVGQSECASTRSCGSNSDTCHILSSNTEANGHGRQRSCSIDTLNSENQIAEEFYTGQYDRNAITYDKEGQKWNCSVCGVEFRSLISVTRHLGHVSHKLEMEKRLREVMMTGKPAWQTTDSYRQMGMTGVLCQRCGKRFLNRTELGVHTALLCRGGGHPRFGEHLLNGEDSLGGEAIDIQITRPRSTQSCHERSEGRVGLVRKRRCSEDLERLNKLQRKQLPSRHTSEEPATLLAENGKAYISNLAWNLNNSGPGRKFNRPASIDSSVSDRQGPALTVLPSGVSEADSNVDSDGNTEIMDFILKQKELFMCKFCKIVFTDKTVYYLHMGLHNLNNPWQCNLCGKPCLDVHEFSSHVIHF
ncbi:zinc finger protein 62 homolog [Lineus longissimus]|uniref:zinc finger protein 62 homolog n=1 Tax=Lineus longissimus TaxID=88925 RepID=UPI00315D2EC1